MAAASTAAIVPPVLLRDAEAIAAHLGLPVEQAQHMHQHGLLPTFRIGGTPHATTGALDEWLQLGIELPPPSRCRSVVHHGGGSTWRSYEPAP